MDEKEFDALSIRAAICPGLETSWPKPETTHGLALHRAGNELRDRVSKTQAAIAAVNADKALSPEGKQAAKEKLATQALDELAKAASISKARELAAKQLQRWADKIAAAIRPPEDHTEAVLHAQVREKVAGLKENKLAFLQKNAADPVVAAALLSAPPFLSGLSETELALLRIECEKKFLGPEIVEAKASVEKALADLQRGERAAKAKIAAAGLNGAKAPVKA